METASAHLRQNLVAYVALFISLGGVSAYAAGEIGSSDIAKNAIRSKHLKDGQVKRKDLASHARGISNPEIVVEASSLTGGQASKSVEVDCPAGKKAIAGGALMNGADSNVYITESSPGDPDGGGIEDTWLTLAQEEGGNDGGSNWDIRGIAICAKVP